MVHKTSDSIVYLSGVKIFTASMLDLCTSSSGGYISYSKALILECANFTHPQHQDFVTCNTKETDIPATLRVLFGVGVAFAVVPLHCTTVPFRLFVAVNVRVEVMSARVTVLITTMGLVVFVRVATKSKSAQSTAATSLQSKLFPTGVVLVNWMGSFAEMNGSTIQARAIP